MSRRTRRLRRTLGWDRNPLRRRIDRVYAVIVAALLVSFLAAAPVVSAIAGHVAAADVTAWQHAGRNSRQVSAIIEHQRAIPAELAGLLPTTDALARWTAPDGRRRSGWVATGPGARAGSRVRVWVDSSGAMARPPFRPPVTELRILAEVTAPAMLALVLYAAGRAARLVLDRRRLAGWEKAWQAVGPQWSRPR